MNRWKSIRIPFLMGILMGTLLIFGKGFLASPSERTELAPINFPATVPLDGWRFLGSVSPENTETTTSVPEEQREYRYARNGKLLEIKMHYIGGGGKLLEILEGRYQVKLSAVDVRWLEGTGHYGLFRDKQRVHLNACINPRGTSTFTSIQHQQNKMLYDVRLERLPPWLLGQKRLIDLRCFWADLSLPLVGINEGEAYKILEDAFASWHPLWQANFFPF